MYLFFKRILDFVFSLFCFVILFPLFIILFTIIKIESKGPAIFKQKRVGKNRKHFYIYKFRTMKFNTPKEKATHELKNPKIWITKIGKFLRKSSLDEIPQIFNILRGEMSIIGPRPALWNQDDLINEREELGVHNLYPGITGYAQINGRDELSIKEKAALDHYYLKNISLKLDIKIFFSTIFKIIKSDGIVEGNKKNEKK